MRLAGKPARMPYGPRSRAEAVLDPLMLLCRAHRLPAPLREQVFLKDRKFRADYLWWEARVIVEQDGGIWRKGGHSTGSGILRDMEKANLAQVDGWVYLRFTPQQIQRGECLGLLQQVLR